MEYLRERCASILHEVFITSLTALPSLCLKTEAIFSCAQEIEAILISAFPGLIPMDKPVCRCHVFLSAVDS